MRVRRDGPSQCESQIRRRLKPQLRQLLQATVHDRGNRWRHLRRQIFRVLVDDGVHHRRSGVPGERRFATEHLIKQHAQTEYIGAVIYQLSQSLLRRHAASGAHYFPAFRKSVTESLRGDRRPHLPLSNAEIQDFHLALGRQHYVAGFQIAMHQPGGVRRSQAVGNLRRDLRGFPRRQGAGGQHLPQ